jgi:hypothetical protein
MNERFDMSDAPSWLGRHVEIELEIRRGDDTPIETEQLRGVIERISEGEGIMVRLDPSGDEYYLPPDFTALEPATGEGDMGASYFRTRQVLHKPPPEMDVPPVDELPNKNPMLVRDATGGYRSAEETGTV